MKFGVVIFPGSNCDHDMIYALEAGLEQEVVPIWHKERSLNGFSTSDWVVLPGGFAYGDYLRSGAIARFSPVMASVKEFAQCGGHLLGVCNGFQVLCEAGLLPGALLRNTHQRFSCRHVFLRAVNRHTPLTQHVPGRPIRIPIAHSEGCFFAAKTTLQDLHNNDQVLFRYCDEKGKVSAASNPNGSSDHIAGICNAEKNVFGMMPHPERAADELLGNTDGLYILRGMLEAIPAKTTSTT